ncbi:MAG TPA: ACP S-malonyltransferase [Thermotogota bacterium]|nr:ACP S-malonyltransferase [Thermotogota bacterium]HPJ89291.1 ACP S-malonyltransferase [Thermotogota bacterium]HPR95162.1 ACP S-malonyltransferase [Thermotogota bacterium]
MKKAFVFPGQGSQSTGMGSNLVKAFPEYREYYDKAATAIGEDIYDIINSEDDTKLTLTQFTQPAILTTSVIAYEHTLKTTGLRPDAVAGHSLGEWTALVAAGALNFGDAVRLVHLRGKYMSEACPPGVGTMAAVLGLEAEEIEEALKDIENVCLANINSPGQIVISGAAANFDAAEEALKAKGAKRFIRLTVSGPFHSPLIENAKISLRKAIEQVQFSEPKIPVYQNVDAKPHKDLEVIKENLIAQITSPVRWIETVQNMSADGVNEFYEIGHGGVLSGLIKRIDRSVSLDRFDKFSNK